MIADLLGSSVLTAVMMAATILAPLLVGIWANAVMGFMLPALP